MEKDDGSVEQKIFRAGDNQVCMFNSDHADDHSSGTFLFPQSLGDATSIDLIRSIIYQYATDKAPIDITIDDNTITTFFVDKSNIDSINDIVAFVVQLFYPHDIPLSSIIKRLSDHEQVLKTMMYIDVMEQFAQRKGMLLCRPVTGDSFEYFDPEKHPLWDWDKWEYKIQQF